MNSSLFCSSVSSLMTSFVSIVHTDTSIEEIAECCIYWREKTMQIVLSKCRLFDCSYYLPTVLGPSCTVRPNAPVFFKTEGPCLLAPTCVRLPYRNDKYLVTPIIRVTSNKSAWFYAPILRII